MCPGTPALNSTAYECRDRTFDAPTLELNVNSYVTLTLILSEEESVFISPVTWSVSAGIDVTAIEDYLNTNF